MNKPINFDNEIVQPKNLNFLANSTDQANKDTFTTLFGSTPGVDTGLNIIGNPGDGTFTITSGFGYTGDGERVQVYSGTTFVIAFTGTRSIFLNYTTVDYNPDPSVNPTQYVNTNIDPISNAALPTESYIFPAITLSSGPTYINLGQVVTQPNIQTFESGTTVGRQSLTIGGFLNLNSSSIDGSIIELDTIDSDQFINPLHYNIHLNTGVSILNNSTGNFLGSASNPFSGIYTSELTVHEIHGSSPIIIDGGFKMLPGVTINSIAGPLSIDGQGSGSTFGGSVTTNSILGTFDQNISIASLGTGTLTLKSTNGNSKIIIGSNNIISGLTTLMNDLTLNTGVSIYTAGGASNLGSTGSRISNIYSTNTNSLNISGNNITGNAISANTITTTQLNASQIGSLSTPIPSLYVTSLFSAASPFIAGAQHDTFTSNNSWLCPSGISRVKVRMWGAGGGGGGGADNAVSNNGFNGAAGGASYFGTSTNIARGGNGGGGGLYSFSLGGIAGTAPVALLPIISATSFQSGSFDYNIQAAGKRNGGTAVDLMKWVDLLKSASGNGPDLSNSAVAGQANTGQAGGGGGGVNAGGGGGAPGAPGEYAEWWLTVVPGIPYTIIVGVGGTGGVKGGGISSNGGNGGSGLVIIEY
jgi:hypothetical protein